MSDAESVFETYICTLMVVIYELKSQSSFTLRERLLFTPIPNNK